MSDILSKAELDGGKKLPVDEDPCDGGNIIVVGTIAHVLGKEDLGKLSGGVSRYRSHFSTCPQAGEWRGRGLE